MCLLHLFMSHLRLLSFVSINVWYVSRNISSPAFPVPLHKPPFPVPALFFLLQVKTALPYGQCPGYKQRNRACMFANILMQEEDGDQDNLKSLYSLKKLAYFADDCNSLSHSHSQTWQELEAPHLGKASKGSQKACNSLIVA